MVSRLIPSRAASPPPTQMMTLCTLPSRILTARQNMVDTGFYLAEEDVLDNVCWIRDDRANCLAIKATTPSASESSGTGEVAASSYPSPPPDEKFKLAPLCAIMTISTHDYWLTADANYCKGSKVWRELVNVKPSCSLEGPHPQPVRDEFKKVMVTIRRLQDMISTPGYQRGKGFILPGGISGERLKVRHALFEPLGPDEEEEESAIEANESSRAQGSDESDGLADSEEAKNLAAFAMTTWPLTDENARDELLSLKETHRIVPIPAYNLQGKLITPDVYKQSLEEALVEVYFNMSHWSIAGKKGEVGSDVFTADIQMIRVIAPPRPTVGGTPRKRKISLYVEPAATPSKRRRTA